MVSDDEEGNGIIELLRLNPCFSGRWSLTSLCKMIAHDGLSLNPCFNGRWSLTTPEDMVVAIATLVLILVLVEDGL